MTSRAALVVAAAMLAGCGGGPQVMRVVDGRVVAGSYVEPEAYAAFLRGAIAEEEGRWEAALAAYGEAARADAEEPEVWTRIGAVRCKMAPRDASAEIAFERALRIDAAYAPAWDARARCALLRGQPAEAYDAGAEAARHDAQALDPQVLVAMRDDAAARADEARRRLVALTLVHGDRAAAWDALAAWGRAHHDAALEGEALGHVAALAPARSAEIADAALRIAGDGAVGAARALAGTIVDVAPPPGPRSSAPSAQIARLAVDDALAAGDADRAARRAIRMHLSSDVVGARALLVGRPDLARAAVAARLDAEPSDAAAHMVAVVAADAEGSDARSRAVAELVPATRDVEADVALVFARMIDRRTTPDAARAVFTRLPRARLLAHDALTTALAADLAARGVVDSAELPADARIELAARRGDAPSDADLEGADARHRLLGLASKRPGAPDTAAQLRALAPSASRDALVAVAVVRVALATGHVEALPRDVLTSFDPADPLVAAAALDLAVRRGDAVTIPSARARLMAVAHTPAERARAH